MSDGPRASLGLKLAAAAGLLFLHLPLLLILLYAFTTEDKSYAFPPPGLPTHWFAVAWERDDIWRAISLSARIAAVSTLMALVLGTLAAAAVARSRFFGREAISLLLILPIALPGIITGISLRSAFALADIPFSFWTIVLGHATFCIVVVYNNVIARLRRMSASFEEASADLGADPWQTFRRVTLPNMRTAIVAGALLALAAAVVIALVATGGGDDELDDATVQRDVSRFLASRLESSTTASCPPGIAKKAGTTFTCTGRTAEGGEVRVAVRELDDSGSLTQRITSATYDDGPLVDSIRSYYRENKRRLGYDVATLSCPAEYDAVSRRSLTCKARYTDDVKANIDVTVHGPANRFKWFEVGTAANKGSSG